MPKKKSSNKPYRPLWDLLGPRWDENWDDCTKMAALITGGDNAYHIRYCVQHDFLDVDLVLERIREFIGKREPFPFEIKDADSVYVDLNRTMTFCKERLNETTGKSKSLDELLLLMFELGSQVGALNNQDMIQNGYSYKLEKHIAAEKSAEKNIAKGELRQKAYVLALRKALSTGIFKATAGGLRGYLKSLNGSKFSTEIAECDYIWIENNQIFDSIGKYSDSSISAVIKKYFQ